MSKRNVSEALKKRVAGRQYYKCQNKPGLELRGLVDYKCPLWKISGECKGCFDESGYEIDHIIEHSISADDNEDNLQALCKLCHAVKTKRYNMQPKKTPKKVATSKKKSNVVTRKKTKNTSKNPSKSPSKNKKKIVPDTTSTGIIKEIFFQTEIMIVSSTIMYLMLTMINNVCCTLLKS